MKLRIILTILAMMLFCSGCSTLYNPIRQDDELSGLNLSLGDDAVKLKESADIIDTETTKVKIKQEATKIFMVANDLVRKDLTAKKIKAYTESLEAKVEALINAKNRRIEEFFMLGIYLGGAMVVVCIILLILCYTANLYNLSGLAVMLGIAGTLIMIAAGVAYYYFWIAVTFVAIILAGLFVIIIVKAIKDNKSLTELVSSAQIFKDSSNDEEAKKAVDTIQSKTTKKIVATLKKKNAVKVATGE